MLVEVVILGVDGFVVVGIVVVVVVVKIVSEGGKYCEWGYWCKVFENIFWLEFNDIRVYFRINIEFG